MSIYMFGAGAGAGAPTHLIKDTLQRSIKDGSARIVMIPTVSDKASMLIYATPKPVV